MGRLGTLVSAALISCYAIMRCSAPSGASTSGRSGAELGRGLIKSAQHSLVTDGLEARPEDRAEKRIFPANVLRTSGMLSRILSASRFRDAGASGAERHDASSSRLLCDSGPSDETRGPEARSGVCRNSGRASSSLTRGLQGPDRVYEGLGEAVVPRQGGIRRLSRIVPPGMPYRSRRMCPSCDRKCQEYAANYESYLFCTQTHAALQRSLCDLLRKIHDAGKAAENKPSAGALLAVSSLRSEARAVEAQLAWIEARLESVLLKRETVAGNLESRLRLERRAAERQEKLVKVAVNRVTRHKRELAALLGVDRFGPVDGPGPPGPPAPGGLANQAAGGQWPIPNLSPDWAPPRGPGQPRK